MATLGTPGRCTRVDVEGSLAVAADDSVGIEVIDVSNPLAPTWLSTYPLSGRVRTVKLEGNLTYSASLPGGMGG